MLTPLRQRMKAVGDTYWSRPLWLFAMALAAMMSLAALLAGGYFAESDELGAIAAGAMFSMVMTLAWMQSLSEQARWQFAQPLSQLAPGYQHPHRVVLVALATAPLLAFVLTAALIAPHFIGIGLGLAALSAAIALQAIALQAIGSRLFFPLWLLFLFGHGTRWFDVLVTWVRAHPFAANVFGVAIAGWALVRMIQQIRSLSQLREDDAGYTTPTWYDRRQAARTRKRGGMQKAAERETAKRSWQQTKPAGFDRWLARARRWRPTRRLLLGYLSEFTGTIGVILPRLWFVPALAVLRGWEFYQDGLEAGWTSAVRDVAESLQDLTRFAAWFVPLAISTAAGYGLAGRVGVLPAERMLPITRSDYTNALMGFWAGASFVAWAAFNALGWFAGGWEPPLNADPESFAPLVAYVVATLACVMFNYGFAALISATGAEMAQVVATLIVVGIVDGLLMGEWWGYSPRFGWGAIITSAPLAAGSGVLMALKARTLWRDREAG
ncbi:MAG: hypothetical protein KDA44_11375 [Planctomycetales bacterium]|nr:hypothetical protein [Planctomycetales bacterium]